MHKYLSISLLIISAEAFSQPAGYTEGTQVCWTFNSRGHGFFMSPGWTVDSGHVLVFFPGLGETDCSTYDGMEPGRILRDGAGGSNWDAIVNLPDGSNRKWVVFIMTHQGNQPNVYRDDIAFFFQNSGVVFDTADHGRFHIAGGSAGVGNAQTFLNNTTNNPYRFIFSTGIWMTSTFTTASANIPAKNFCWYAIDDDPEGNTPPSATKNFFNQLPGIQGVDKFIDSTDAGHNNTTWGDCFRIDGTTYEDNRWLWMIYEGEDITPPAPFEGEKIPIGKWHYADLSGADGLAAKNTWYYFDSEWDILTGNTSTIDTTDGRTYAKSAIMHRRFGQRDIWINFQKPFVVTAIYGKRRNGSTSYPDTVTFFSRGSRINNLDFLASDKRTRNDFLFQAISIGNNTAWEQLWLGLDTTQYLLINLRRNTYTVPFTQGTDGNYQDFVFYGYELEGGVAETTYNVASELQLDNWINNTPKEKLRSHAGANFSNIYMVRDYRNLGVMRGYNNQWHHFDSVYPGNKMNMNGLRPDSTGWVTHNKSVLAEEPDKFNHVVVNGTNPWVMNVQSKRLYDSATSSLWGSDSFKPTDSIGMDPAYPQNYKTFSNNLSFMIDLFGQDNTKTIKGRPKGDYPMPAPGVHKVFTGIEVGNEDDIDVHDSAYMLPLERAAKWWACWDGFLGTMNTGDSVEFGIHLADPNAKVITDATVGWNYKPLCAAILCAKIIAQADTLPFNMVATHLYHSNTKVNPGVPSSVTNVGAHGIPPEMFGYPDDIDSMARAIRRFLKKPPSQIELTNNEWGWDKTYQRPLCSSGCDTNFFNTTSYGLPRNNIGMDSSKWHSVLLMRGTAIFAASHYNQSVVFTFNDDDDPQDPGLIFPYSFSGINGYYYRNQSTFNVDSVEYSAAAFHYRGMLKRFGNYYVENVIDKTSGGRWVMQWKSSVNPDTLMYMVWEGDSTQTGVSYNVPVPAGKDIVEWIPSTTNVNGSESERMPTAGAYTASGGVEPRFFMVFSGEMQPGQPTHRIKKKFRGSLKNKFRN